MKKAQQQKCFNPNTKIKCTTFMLKRKYFRKNMHFKWNVNDGQNRKKNRKNTLSCMLEYQESITAGKINPTIPGTSQCTLFENTEGLKHFRNWQGRPPLCRRGLDTRCPQSTVSLHTSERSFPTALLRHRTVKCASRSNSINYRKCYKLTVILKFTQICTQYENFIK